MIRTAAPCLLYSSVKVYVIRVLTFTGICDSSTCSCCLCHLSQVPVTLQTVESPQRGGEGELAPFGEAKRSATINKYWCESLHFQYFSLKWTIMNCSHSQFDGMKILHYHNLYECAGAKA